MSGQPIDIHYGKMKEWLDDRASLFGKKHAKELQLCLTFAPQMVQAVRYDIPAMKKTIARLNNQRTETLASVDDAPRAEQQQKTQQRQLLASYGMSADKLEHGATTLEKLLEDRIAEVESSVTLFLAEELPKILPKCFLLYDNQLATIGHSKGDAASAAHFPWLSRVLEESEKLAAAARVQRSDTQRAGDVVDERSDEPTVDIDWGDDDGGVTGAVASGAQVDIKWDDDESTDTTPADASPGCGHSSAVAEDVGAPPARNWSDAPTVVVARGDHRAALVHELSALEAFLDEHALDTMQRDGVADTLEQRMKHCPALVSHANDVVSVIKRLTIGNEANLLRMRNNFRLKEKWINTVEDTDRVIARIRARAATADQRVAAMTEEVSKIGPQMEELIATSKSQQKACEEALQRVFPDREVLIVGDINAL